MNLMLHVCESRTSHFRSIASLSVQISLLEFLLMYENEFESREKRNIFIIELCESYDASNRRQARDELVVMTRANDREREVFL